MQIGFIVSPGRGRIDPLIAAVADRLQAEGLRLTGVVQTNTDRPGSHRCDMDVRILPHGPVVRISQNLGREARGCQLNPEALEQSVGEVMRRLEAGTVDLLILNKFGKQEMEGRGFRPAIAEALGRGVPVLTGINDDNRAAFDAFVAGMAEALPPDFDAILDWVAAVRAAVAAA